MSTSGMGRIWFTLGILMGFLCVETTGVSFAQISCAPPPPPPPKRISGGEGVPPLPLPATPIRRTERKRPPAPPTLFAKVNYANDQIENEGKKTWNWTTATGDTDGLFRYVRGNSDINYKADVVRLNQFQYQPENVPVMYFTGRQGFEFSQEQRNALRKYVMEGGAIFGAAGNGEKAFADSFVKEMRGLFPDRPWALFPQDHPIYTAHYKMEGVQYRRGANDTKTLPPMLEGIHLGCRAAVVLSRADLSCGWDNHTHPDGFRVMPDDAKKLGLNLVEYLLANYRLGRVESTPVAFREDPNAPADLEIGQIVHDGDWDPSPSSVQYLMKEVSQATSAYVSYKRTPVNPANDDVFKYPFLYLTGHLDFHLSDAAVNNLRKYVEQGGFIFISNCCNRHDFELAARREIARILPKQRMETLAAGHAIYSTHFNLDAKATTSARLEGIANNGVLQIVYSPTSVGCAWDGEPRPFVKLPEPDLARKIGVNTMVYAMTH